MTKPTRPKAVRAAAPRAAADPQALFNYLLDFAVDVPGGGTATMRRLHAAAEIDPVARDALARHGLALIKSHRGRRTRQAEGRCWLFIFGPLLASKVLAGSPWEGAACDRLLLSLPGAARAQRKLTVGGKVRFGVQVPLWPALGERPLVDG